MDQKKELEGILMLKINNEVVYLNSEEVQKLISTIEGDRNGQVQHSNLQQKK